MQDPEIEAPSSGAAPSRLALMAGLPSDVRPLDHLRSVLESTSAGDGRKLLVLTHRSPDPDALGALAGLGYLLEHALGQEHTIATTGRIFRAENKAMVRELKLSFANYEEIRPEDYRGVMLVDTQPSFGHTSLPEGVPVLAVFDHHEPQNGAAHAPVPHNDLRLGLGSTSAMMYEYVRDAGVEIEPPIATALCCGVRFDTADLSMHATPLDIEAFHETFRLADRRMLARISRPTLPSTYYRELHRSLSRARRYGPLVYGLLGRVTNPESVAEMADFFLRMEGCRWSFVGGAYGGMYHLSLRTRARFGDAYPVMAAILEDEGSFGGRGSVAGGQIPLEAEDDSSLRNLQRRLRARALKQVPADERAGTDPKTGIRLTRLP